MEPEKSKGLTVAIATWRRPEALRETLHRVLACRPAPAEVRVHVDAGDAEAPVLLEAEFAGLVKWCQSNTTQGPGGGRNRLFREAEGVGILSLDDDSWPLDDDFFARAAALLAAHPKAGVIGGRVLLPGETVPPSGEGLTPAASFENCGCVIRREAFQEVAGFVPLRYGYGMEEADVALQLMDRGWGVYQTEALRFFHDTALQHHVSPQVNAAHIANTALLVFLRYPIAWWPLGLLQVANRVRYAAGVGRWRGILRGLLSIPWHCWTHRRYRRTVRSATLRQARRSGRAV